MLLQNYDLLDIIGEGGFGIVYKAKQLSTNQLVAIKVLKIDGAASETKKQHHIARFERETQLCARLNHPNIVKLLDKGSTDDHRLYAVFEYVEGQTLKDLILDKNGLSPVETAELMGQVLDGLASAHSLGIVHRDLKPTNIMVTKTGLKQHAKILDFGIGAFTSAFQPSDYAVLTLTKETIGTPAYSAPEQLRGDPPSTKSDLYAWGLILLECLTGSPVMRGESVGEVFEQQLSANQVPLPPALLEHTLGKLLRNVLEKNPLHRPAEAQHVAEEYGKVNFQTLVGRIQMPHTVDTDADVTAVTDLGYHTHKVERRQITVLCVQLDLTLAPECNLDEESLDTLQEDQLTLVTELSTRYGGYLAGAIADTITVYFGYPQKGENDARYAGRTALELISQAKKRSVLLMQQHGVELDMRMGIHSGMVLLKKNTVPKGHIPNTAFALLNKAGSDTVLVSSTTKQLLDPFLEFEPAGEIKLAKQGGKEKVYTLKGERASEALNFLRPWSANRSMIGRDQEFSQVSRAWEALDEGAGQARLISGQAGIGKSKLLFEWKRLVGERGFPIVETRCLPEYRNSALYPFLVLLKNRLGILDLDEDSEKINSTRHWLEKHGANVEQMLPILCSWLGVPLDNTVTGSQLPPDTQKALLLDLLKSFIMQLGDEQKFLMVVEDMHWMDPTSVEFVEALLEELSSLPFLLLLTARPEFSPDWTFAGYDRIPLVPLDQDRTRRMILGVLDTGSVDEKTVHYISERADGVPLFIEELTHMLLDREFLILKDDTYQLDYTQDMSRVPVRLNDLLNARLDRLGFAKETAQLASVIGREFSYDLLVAASLRDEGMLQSDLEALANADLVYHRRVVSGDTYLFRHALIRDSAYESISKRERVEMNLRIAEAMETSFPSIVAENAIRVANHFAEGENWTKAVQFGIKAAENSLGLAAMKETIALCNQVLGWVKNLDGITNQYHQEFEVNGVLFPAILTVYGLGSRELEVIAFRNQFLDDELQKADWTGHIKNDLDARFLQKYVELQGYFYQGKFAEGVEKSEEFLAELDAQKSVSKRIIISCGMGQGIYAQGRVDEAMELMREMLALYDPKRDRDLWKTIGIDPRAYLLCTLGLCLTWKGNTNKAVRLVEEAYSWAKEIHCPSFEDFSKLCISWTAYFRYDRETAISNHVEYFAGKVESADNLLHRYARILKDWAIGDPGYMGGVLAEMLAAENYGAVGSVWEALYGETLIGNGSLAEAEERLQNSLDRCRAFNDRIGQPLVMIQLAIAKSKIEGSLTNEAKKLFVEALELTQQMRTPLLELHVLVGYIEQEDDGLAKQALIEKLSETVAHFAGTGDVPILAQAMSII